jgi:2-oxoglutarate dehydrogenase E1 component
LIKNEAFNQFLKNKFNTLKRFSIEGSDSFISGLECIVDNAVGQGIEHIVFGIPHRGLLNTLTNVPRKPREEIFAEFQDIKETVLEDGVWRHAGDVKHHLGVSQDRQYGEGKKINLVSSK